MNNDDEKDFTSDTLVVTNGSDIMTLMPSCLVVVKVMSWMMKS